MRSRTAIGLATRPLVVVSRGGDDDAVVRVRTHHHARTLVKDAAIVVLLLVFAISLALLGYYDVEGPHSTLAYTLYTLGALVAVAALIILVLSFAGCCATEVPEDDDDKMTVIAKGREDDQPGSISSSRREPRRTVPTPCRDATIVLVLLAIASLMVWLGYIDLTEEYGETFWALWLFAAALLCATCMYCSAVADRRVDVPVDDVKVREM